MTPEQEDWVRLSRAGLPARVAVELLERLGSPGCVLEASDDQLRSAARLTPRHLKGLEEARRADLERDLQKLVELDVALVTLRDTSYPANLREIADPPPLLFVRGRLDDRDQRAVAVVGSRSASPYGRVVAESLGRDLARAGVTVISGLAVGADAASQRGALNAGGRTIGVLGCGIDIAYPRDSAELIEEIVAKGSAVIAEFAPGARPERWRFPVRNRLISGLAMGVVVVEAPEHSGALITARHAGEQGRSVFAVPGSVNSVQSRGTHDLIRDGATLVNDVNDILSELDLPEIAPAPAPSAAVPTAAAPEKPKRAPAATTPPAGAHRPAAEAAAGKEAAAPPPESRPQVSDDEDRLLSILSLHQKYVDQIIEESKLPPAQVNAGLMMLELKGLVRRLPGNLFVRIR